MAGRKPQIAIVGGSFAGLSAALALPEAYDVTLLDRRSRFEWTPNVHELVSGVKAPELLSLDLHRLLHKKGHRFLQTEVTGLSVAERQLLLGNHQPLDYDACLLGMGGADIRSRIPGALQHSIGFRTVADCHQIGQQLARLSQQDRFQVCIVGAGVSGIEALGEVLRIYRSHPGLQVHVLETAAQVMPGTPPELDEEIRARCSDYPVFFHLQTQVQDVGPEHVQLSDGRHIASDLTIWAAGQASPELLVESGLLPTANDKAPVRRSLQSRVAPEIFMAGDCAQLSIPVSRQAYHAIEMGEHAANGIQRFLRNRKPRKYKPSRKPILVAFGDLDTYLVAGPLVIASPSLAGAKEALFQGGMALFAPPLGKQEARAIYSRFSRSMRSLLIPQIASIQDALALGRYRRIA